MLPSDVNILVSVLNCKLRDFYDSLESLCDDLDESLDDILNKLAKAGYYYDNKTNQIKPRA